MYVQGVSSAKSIGDIPDREAVSGSIEGSTFSAQHITLAPTSILGRRRRRETTSLVVQLREIVEPLSDVLDRQER